MKNEFANRQNMHFAVLALLADPAHEPIWKAKKPLIVATPAAAISGRKALTKVLRPNFREVSELLAKMDRPVLRFRNTEPGARFAEAWKAARQVRDLGQAAPPEPILPVA